MKHTPDLSAHVEELICLVCVLFMNVAHCPHADSMQIWVGVAYRSQETYHQQNAFALFLTLWCREKLKLGDMS